MILALLIVLVLPKPTVHAQDDAAWLYNQINSLRASLGLPGYAWNGALNTAAQAHSEWMAATGIISHEGEFDRGPGDRAATYGYQGRFVSENIFGGLSASPQQAWNFWANSGIHYAAITHSAKNEVGIGFATGDGLVYYTLMVGEGSGIDAPPAPPQPVEAAPAPEPVAEVAQVAQQAPPPSAPTEPPPPPTRPPITWTPSATIPSQTPTITWTPTYTWTPSPTASIPPPTSTPIRLATAAPLPTHTEIAIVPSPTQVVLQLSPINPPEAEEKPSNFSVRLLLPFIIAAQVIGIGWVVWRLWSRRI